MNSRNGLFTVNDVNIQIGNLGVQIEVNALVREPGLERQDHRLILVVGRE